MRLVVKKQNIHLVLSMRERAQLLGNGRWREEAFRGVVDAGRMTKTRVQRSTKKQMALLKYSPVVAGTRGTPVRTKLAYEIYSYKGGLPVQEYAGLRAVSEKGRAAKRFNASRSIDDRGFVRSGVWNAPRTFKRSFAANGGFYAMLPPKDGIKAPRILWTHDDRSWQPRDAGGRFGETGTKYGKVRRLFGGALRKELVKDQALATFYKVGPVLLEQKVTKRMARFLKI